MSRAARPPVPVLRRRARGLSMIEVLVAMVVLAIGLLGLAGLQASGMKVTQGSTMRWKASEVAADLADRMRANRSGFVSTSFTATVAAGATGAATPTAVAATSLSDWITNRLTALPPGASVTVTVGALPTPAAAITITWDDTRAGTAASGQFQMYTSI